MSALAGAFRIVLEALRASPAPALPETPMEPSSSPPVAPVSPSEVALDAGFKFFMGSAYDGHEDDRAPGEAFSTRFGVTEMTYNAALVQGVVTKPFADCHSPDDMKPIYRKAYYDANRCGEMPACVAMVLFVDSTLMGLKGPARNLQSIVGAFVDGDIGDKTIAAVRASDPQSVAKRLEAADLEHLSTLANWGVFKNGWTNREQNLLAAALELT